VAVVQGDGKGVEEGISPPVRVGGHRKGRAGQGTERRVVRVVQEIERMMA